MLRQQGHDLAVPAPQPHPPATGDQQRLVPAEGREGVPRGLRPPVEQGQSVLRRPGHRPDERQGVRVREPVAAGEVHRAQHPARPRIPHRRRRAGPRVHPAAEVLGPEDLHGLAHRDRRPGGVGPHRRLRPARARDEAEALGAPQGGRFALHPQQAAPRVAHRQQVRPARGERADEVPEQRHHAGQRVLLPVGAKIRLRELHPRCALRAQPGPRAPPPGPCDDRPDRGLHPSVPGEHGVRPPQFP